MTAFSAEVQPRLLGHVSPTAAIGFSFYLVIGRRALPAPSGSALLGPGWLAGGRGLRAVVCAGGGSAARLPPAVGGPGAGGLGSAVLGPLGVPEGGRTKRRDTSEHTTGGEVEPGGEVEQGVEVEPGGTIGTREYNKT